MPAKLLVVVVACAGMLFGSLVLATPANAAVNGCNGSFLASKPIYHGSTKIGELDLYWDAAARHNCATTVHSGPTYGVRTPTSVQVWALVPPSPDLYPPGQAPDVTGRGVDSGNYGYYANASTKIDTSHYCVEAVGNIVWAGSNHVVTLGPAWCG